MHRGKSNGPDYPLVGSVSELPSVVKFRPSLHRRRTRNEQLLFEDQPRNERPSEIVGDLVNLRTHFLNESLPKQGSVVEPRNLELLQSSIRRTKDESVVIAHRHAPAGASVYIPGNGVPSSDNSRGNLKGVMGIERQTLAAKVDADNSSWVDEMCQSFGPFRITRSSFINGLLTWARQQHAEGVLNLAALAEQHINRENRSEGLPSLQPVKAESQRKEKAS